MQLKEIAYKTEELLCRTKQINGVQLAMSVAIFSGDYAVKDYEWAFNMLLQETCRLEKDLEGVMNELFREYQENKGKTGAAAPGERRRTDITPPKPGSVLV